MQSPRYLPGANSLNRRDRFSVPIKERSRQRVRKLGLARDRANSSPPLPDFPPNFGSLILAA
ncbi:MAG: hypothetical protein F6J93_10725 [Oscillatoria sp. SIO1A7]|nr:hypothetical protein [Oscillatoria sp. SIO1A7]